MHSQSDPQGDIEDDVDGFKRTDRWWCGYSKESSGDRIPGKVHGDILKYSENGVVKTTFKFAKVESNDYSDKPGPFPQGSHAGKHFWCAVAITPSGRIPGKADADGTCWYVQGGVEHKTTDFLYLN